MGRHLVRLAAVTAAVVLSACAPRPPAHELRGIVVRVDAGRQEITIKHEDIPRFMPGMTMPFKVRDPRLLEGRVPGDLVRGTLVVEESDAYLRTLERTGTGPIPEGTPPPAPVVLSTGEPVPDATFVGQDGRAHRLSDWRGQALAVTFMYTRCPLPNFCPLMDQHFKAAQAAVKEDPQLRGRVRLLSVSFDPAYDRPAVLASRAQQLEADPAVWSFLTGERSEVERFASRFGVSVVREDAGAEDIVHNLRTVVVDPDGRLAATLRGSEWTPQDLTAELRTVLARR